MKLKHFITFVATIAIMASCSSEDMGNNALNNFVLKASVDNSTISTRAGFDSGAKFYWSKNDQLGVTTTNSKTRFSALTLQGEGGAASGTFTGDIYGTIEGYAVYPHNKNHKMNNEGILTYQFPANYEYNSVDTEYFHTTDQGKANSFNFAMWGKIQNGSVGMKHLGGVFMVAFTSIPAEGTFILSADQKLNGNYSVDLNSNTPEVVIDGEYTPTDAEKQVVISYTNATDGQTGVFYVPAPTGNYTNVTATIINAEGETIKEVACGDIEIKRAYGKILNFTNGSISGGGTEEVDNVEEANKALQNENVTSVKIEEVSANETIVVPEKTSSDIASVPHSIDLSNVTLPAEGVLNIQVNKASTEDLTVKELTVVVPDNTESTSQLNIDAPGTTVIIQTAAGTVIDVLTASTADETLVIGADVQVNTLIVKKGNVRIENGGKVQTIQRQDNQDNVTYVIYESATAPTIELGEGVLLVSVAEFDLLTAVANGGEIVLTSDVVLTTPLVIADGKTVTIDLNGHIISQSKECAASYSMITNKGALTIKDTSSEGDGKITFQDLSNGGGSVWGSYVITNNGTLVVENGTLEHLGSANPEAHNTNLPIQNYAGKVTINGGVISSKDFRSLRDFTAGGEIIINGGVFKGQVWMQGLGNGSSSLTINGGEFSPLQGYDGSSVYITNNTNDIIVTINGGKFNTKIGCADVAKAGIKGSVKGGIFTESAKTNTNNALIAEGCAFVETADGYWEIGKSWEKISETSYTIYSASGMRWFAEQVNSGQETFAGKTITLAKDIDLNNEEWTPIGTFENSFDGNFDGQNHVIKNLKITSSVKGEVYIGLFGVTANNKIENFTIENVNISSEGQIVATAVAYPYYTDVKNITVQGNVNIKGGNYTAGVIAYTRYCVNASNLSIVGNSGSSIIGAITVGGVIPDIQMNGGIVANYSNFAASGLTISGTNAVGGISGIISGQTLDGASVKNVTLECTGKQVGIISGSMGSSSILKNLTIENVTGTNVVIGGNYGTGNPIEAKIGNQYYSLFSEALTNVKNGETITLLSNITLEEALTISKEQNLTIDLNGKTINAGLKEEGRHHYAIDNYGTLVIEGTGAINARGIENFGTMTINGDIIITNIDTNGGAAIWNEGTLTINKGTFTTNTTAGADSYGAALNTRSGGVAVVNGGNFSAYSQLTYAIINEGTTTINNAVVKGKHGAVSGSGGTTFIKDGSFELMENPGISDHCTYMVSEITGGKFTLGNNTDSGAQLFYSSIVAEGYKTIVENGWTKVVKE